MPELKEISAPSDTIRRFRITLEGGAVVHLNAFLDNTGTAEPIRVRAENLPLAQAALAVASHVSAAQRRQNTRRATDLPRPEKYWPGEIGERPIEEHPAYSPETIPEGVKTYLDPATAKSIETLATIVAESTDHIFAEELEQKIPAETLREIIARGLPIHAIEGCYRLGEHTSSFAGLRYYTFRPYVGKVAYAIALEIPGGYRARVAVDIEEDVRQPGDTAPRWDHAHPAPTILRTIWGRLLRPFL